MKMNGTSCVGTSVSPLFGFVGSLPTTTPVYWLPSREEVRPKLHSGKLGWLWVMASICCGLSCAGLLQVRTFRSPTFNFLGAGLCWAESAIMFAKAISRLIAIINVDLRTVMVCSFKVG